MNQEKNKERDWKKISLVLGLLVVFFFFVEVKVTPRFIVLEGVGSENIIQGNNEEVIVPSQGGMVGDC